VPSLEIRAMPDMSPQDLYKQSEMVFYGQVITKENGPGPDYYYYQVKVETYFKNPQTSDSITVAGHKPSESHMAYPQFEVGDKAVFYIVKQDGVLVVSPWSIKAGESCDIHAFLGPAPIPGEPIIRGMSSPLDRVSDVNMTTYGTFKVNQVLLIAYHVWNNFPQSRNVTVELSSINQNDTASSFYKNQIVQVGACDTNTVNWIFAPTKAGYYIVNATEIGKFRAGEDFRVVDSNSSAINSKLVDSPLMQIKSGIAAKDVKCNQGFQLIIKAEDSSPACVAPDTAQKLIERGWAKNPVGVSTLEKPSIGLYNVTASLHPIILGMSFFVNAEVTNNQNMPITYYGGCASPLSISFGNIQTWTDGFHCLAISKYILQPYDQVLVQSDKINTVYNETGPDNANAEIKFTYENNGTTASWFTAAEFPIQHAIKLNCTESFGAQMERIDSSVNVKKAIASAYSSPEFLSKVKQYGNVSYSSFYNNLFPDESCNAYWKGVEVMFTANDKNGSRTIQVSEDITLTTVLKVEDFQVVAN
jgi:hypothetical protein